MICKSQACRGEKSNNNNNNKDNNNNKTKLTSWGHDYRGKRHHKEQYKNKSNSNTMFNEKGKMESVVP